MGAIASVNLWRLHCSRFRRQVSTRSFTSLLGHSLSSGIRGHRFHQQSFIRSFTLSLLVFTLVQASFDQDHLWSTAVHLPGSSIECIKNTRITSVNTTSLQL